MSSRIASVEYPDFPLGIPPAIEIWAKNLLRNSSGIPILPEVNLNKFYGGISKQIAKGIPKRIAGRISLEITAGLS